MSKNSIIVFISVLIVGIILISVGSSFIYFGAWTARAVYGVGITVFGVVIAGLDIIGGIYFVVKSRRKE